ncbi:hypothetical protein BJY01DRAFT_222224 [Aspergillus pseudoustus]|uniref:Uncharacterized protein n=1 Tax=Aspergillus pseudoustus TaxID=1810923 RepID=A0ABR4J9B7_9EURO
MEGLLQKIAGVLDKIVPTRGDAAMPETLTLSPSEPDQTQPLPRKETHESVFMGRTSLSAHTAFANNFVRESVLGSTNFQDLAPEMQAALEHFSNQKPLSYSGLCSLPTPPNHAILRILREVKAGTLRVTFSLICCFMTIDDFIKHCSKVCFAVEDSNLADFIMFSGL